MNSEKVVELTDDLKEALDRLEEALKEAPEEYKSEILLKRFEFSFELAWKLMQAALDQMGAIVSSPNNAIRTAADYNLIDDPEKWIIFLKERNLTVHVYNKDMAANIVEKVRDFPVHAQKFLAKVKELNLLDVVRH